MKDAGPEPLSRRAFFRGKFSAGEQSQNDWFLVDHLAAGSGDVFWNGWADDAGVFIAGDDGVLFHYDGETWDRHATPAPVPIHAMWGRSRVDLWAVGWMGLILYFDGVSWRKVQGCEVDDAGKYSNSAQNTPLFAIAGRDDGQAWAVGDRGVILHFDGEGWSQEPSGTRMHLRTIIELPDGRMMAAGADGAVLLRSDDGLWQPLDCAIHSNFVASLSLSDGTVLLAGGRYFIDANGFRGDLVLWDGEGFSKLFDGAQFSRFRDMALYKNGVVTVGDGGQIHVIRGERIDRIESVTSHDLLGIIGLPHGEVLAVGDFGTVLAGTSNALENFTPYIAQSDTASAWEAVESGTDRQLWGLWHDENREELYACGEEGIVLICDRGQWAALPPVGALGIHTLNRAADGGLLAAGQMGEIHHFDGNIWRKEFDLHMDITILSLWSDGEHYYAVGDEGLVLQKTPELSDWSRMASGTKSALYGLWGPDRDHLLAVGDFGLVQRWNGRTWDEFNAGTEYFLFDVWGRALDDIYVIGLSGTIGHFNGKRWTITPARARSDLLALSGNDEQVIAVGAAGSVYRHDGRFWQHEGSGTDAGLRAISTAPDGGFMAAGDRGTLLSRMKDPDA